MLKEPKFYFYDTAGIYGDFGLKLENIVASALLKELHFLEDTLGYTTRLHYLKNKDGREIDFLVVIENTPILMIEVKWADDSPSKNFMHYSKFIAKVKKIQLVKEIDREKSYESGVEVVSVAKWLHKLDLKAFITDPKL